MFGAWIFFTGCTVGPNYHRPSALTTAPLPESFPGQTQWKLAQPAAHLPRGAWWELFADPELARLETSATEHNQEFVAALARLEQARQSVLVTRADLLPQLESDASAVRQRTSFNEPQNGHAAGVAHTYNTLTLQLQAGWEADVFGRVRRQVEAERARLAAAADDVEAVKLSVQAELATDYFTLRALDAEYELVQQTVKAYTRSWDLTRNRRQGGIASDLDVSQAETQLRTAEAELPVLRLRREKLAHALALLTGQPAGAVQLATPAAASNTVPSVPLALPSDLLERRPDIAAAEQRMTAANAEIGVATAAFYPRVQFNGLAGLQSVDASTWFDWPSRFWSVGPTLQVPLFTGGRNRARLALARASYDETLANYRQTVLAAFQEVEDQLATQALLEEQIRASSAAMSAARHTLEIANNRYQSGLVTYLEVSIAQGAALNLERSVVQIEGDKLVAAVALIKALGGSWRSPPP